MGTNTTAVQSRINDSGLLAHNLLPPNCPTRLVEGVPAQGQELAAVVAVAVVAAPQVQAVAVAAVVAVAVLPQVQVVAVAAVAQGLGPVREQGPARGQEPARGQDRCSHQSSLLVRYLVQVRARVGKTRRRCS